MPLTSSDASDPKTLEILHNVKDVPAFPVVWADENAQIDEPNAKKLKTEAITPIKLVDGFSYLMLICGCILIALSWFMVLCCKQNDGKMTRA